MGDVTRRDLAGMAAMGVAAASMTSMARAATGPDTLDALARTKGYNGFGSCIGGGAEDFASSFGDAGVRGSHERECGIAGCENETKWVALRPNPKEYSFYLADRVVDWAESHGMKMRGHTLLWAKAQFFHKWLLNYEFGARPAAEGASILREH